jgi:hypothetical protein
VAWFDYFAQAAGVPPPLPVTPAATAHDATWETFRRLEAGDLAGVRRVEELERARHGEHLRPMAEMAFALVDAGIERPELLRTCEDLLDEVQLTSGVWSSAAGTVRSPRGVAVMDQLFSRAERRFPDRDHPRLYRALWLSRRGRIDDALALLSGLLTARATELHGAPVLEILCRALWRRARTRTAIPPVPDGWARSLGAACRGPADALWTALRHGDHATALALAAEWHESEPAEPVWALLAVWLAGVSGDRAAVQQWAAQARASLRFHHLHPWAIDELAVLER